MLNPRRVLSKPQILDHVWHYDFDGEPNVVETYVSYVRKKLEKLGPPLIHTIRLVGYTLRRPARSAECPSAAGWCWRWRPSPWWRWSSRGWPPTRPCAPSSTAGSTRASSRRPTRSRTRARAATRPAAAPRGRPVRGRTHSRPPPCATTAGGSPSRCGEPTARSPIAPRLPTGGESTRPQLPAKITGFSKAAGGGQPEAFFTAPSTAADGPAPLRVCRGAARRLDPGAGHLPARGPRTPSGAWW